MFKKNCTFLTGGHPLIATLLTDNLERNQTCPASPPPTQTSTHKKVFFASQKNPDVTGCQFRLRKNTEEEQPFLKLNSLFFTVCARTIWTSFGTIILWRVFGRTSRVISLSKIWGLPIFWQRGGSYISFNRWKQWIQMFGDTIHWVSNNNRVVMYNTQLIADSAQTEYCPTFPLSVRVSVCHRRDISHFSHI